MDWDKTFDGKDILCDEVSTYITVYQNNGKWYAEYCIGKRAPYEMKAQTLEEAKFNASLNFLNALNKKISYYQNIKNGMPSINKLRKAANKMKAMRKTCDRPHRLRRP